MNLLTAYICSQRQINQRKWISLISFSNAQNILKFNYIQNIVQHYPLNIGVPTMEVTDINIMRTFFREQILCPLN